MGYIETQIRKEIRENYLQIKQICKHARLISPNIKDMERDATDILDHIYKIYGLRDALTIIENFENQKAIMNKGEPHGK